MNVFKKIAKFLTTTPDRTPVYWLNVQCDHCGEIIKTRINLYNDLSIHYGKKAQSDTYFCRKVIVGTQRCYRPIEVEMTFNHERKLMERQINGGKFVEDE